MALSSLVLRIKLRTIYLIVSTNSIRTVHLPQMHISRKCIVTLSVGTTFGFGLAYLLLGVLTLDIIGPLTRTPCCNQETECSTENDTSLHTSLASDYGVHGSSEAEELFKSVRVLCWIMTYPYNHDDRARAVKETWGRRCNILLFVSTKEDESLPTVVVDVKESYDTLWGKSKKGFAYVYEHYIDSADWFLKADDDTYVVMENLRYVLHTHSPDEPVYFGRKFRKYAGESYMSGGAGYVLSREALRRFVEIALPNSEACKEDDIGPEDLEMGRCLCNVGVLSGDSRDSSGRGRFFPLEPEAHLIPGYLDYTLWFWEYTNTSSTEGADCCSDTAISFHNIEPQQMHILDYVIYHLRPYGTNIKPMETRPPRYQPPSDTISYIQQSKETEYEWDMKQNQINYI